MSVAVVVVTHGGGPLLSACLDSLEAQVCAPAEVLVVDSGTPGGVPAEARRPGVRVVELGANLGFAAAVNRGVAETRAPLIALLNPDAAAEPAWLAALAGAADAHPEHAWFASRVVAGDRLDSAGHTLTLTGRAVKVGEGERDGPTFDAARAVLGAPASAALYRRSAFERVGPMDESLHLVMEDVEWDLRARARGLSCLYVPGARARHAVSAYRGRGSDSSVYLEDRNTLVVLARHLPRGVLPSMALPWLAHQAWSLVVKARRGQLGAWWTARLDAVKRIAADPGSSDRIGAGDLWSLMDRSWHLRHLPTSRPPDLPT